MDRDRRKDTVVLDEKRYGEVVPARSFSNSVKGKSFTGIPRRQYGEQNLATMTYGKTTVLTLASIGYGVASLTWVQTPSDIAVDHWNVYRGLGVSPPSWVLAGQTSGLTLAFGDTGLTAATVYSWYVQAVYLPAIGSPVSNTVTGTTLQIGYVYTLRSGGMDVFDVRNTASPSVAASLTDANHNAGGLIAHSSVSDVTYLWINDGTNLLTYQWGGHETNPVLVSTVINWNYLVVRRGMATRNNLAFRRNTSNNNIESYDISDPTNPALINSVASPLIFTSETMAYDDVGNNLLMVFNDRNVQTFIYKFSVAANGTLGAAVQIGPNQSGTGADTQGAFLYNGLYYDAVNGTIFTPYKLDGSGSTTPTVTVSGATFHYGAIRPHIRSHYVFFGASVTGGGNAVRIFDLADGTIKADIGGSNVCTGLMTSGNLLFFATGVTLFIYDITALLASGSAPVLLGQVNGPATINGISGYIGDGWDGQNGLTIH